MKDLEKKLDELIVISKKLAQLLLEIGTIVAIIKMILESID